MLLLDSQENYKAAVSSSFQSSSANGKSLPINRSSDHFNLSISFLNTTATLYQDFEFNANRTHQIVKNLFNYLVFDLTTSLLRHSLIIIEQTGEFVDDCSFNLKLFFLLVVILGFILVCIGVSWRVFSHHISDFDFQNFYNRKGTICITSTREN